MKDSQKIDSESAKEDLNLLQTSLEACDSAPNLDAQIIAKLRENRTSLQNSLSFKEGGFLRLWESLQAMLLLVPESKYLRPLIARLEKAANASDTQVIRGHIIEFFYEYWEFRGKVGDANPDKNDQRSIAKRVIDLKKLAEASEEHLARFLWESMRFKIFKPNSIHGVKDRWLRVNEKSRDMSFRIKRLIRPGLYEEPKKFGEEPKLICKLEVDLY